MSLVIEQLTKEYPTRTGPLPVLRGIDLTLKPGDAVAVVGPSGSGKSTLLHIVGTLDRPSAGRVTLDGVDPFALAEPQLADFRNRRIGFVFQDHHLLPQCDVLENVLLPTLVDKSLDRGAVEKEAIALLERVGLADRRSHRPAELSGGERQRAALARALIRKPKLLLADEPTGNLDRTSARKVAELLMELHQTGDTILMAVTHSAELAKLLPRRLEMNDGRLESIS